MARHGRKQQQHDASHAGCRSSHDCTDCEFLNSGAAQPDLASCMSFQPRQPEQQQRIAQHAAHGRQHSHTNVKGMQRQASGSGFASSPSAATEAALRQPAHDSIL